jgi:hypothetical protein
MDIDQGGEMSAEIKFGDLPAVGEELSEEELAGVAGGRPPMGTYIDPPGICMAD